MFKYICAFFIVFSLIACEPRGEEAPPPSQQPEMPAETQQPNQPDPTAQIAEDELNVYVDANVEAREEQVDPITDQEEMEEILEDKEIDYNRFAEIHASVQQTPQLQQEIQQRIQEEQGENPSNQY